ncbi:Polysaccharide biosynthesis protein [compost metagenome]
MRNEVKSVSLLWVSSIFGSGSTFLLYILLARSLGVESFGAFGAAYTVAMFLVIVATFGIPQAMIKIFGRAGREGILWVGRAFTLLAITVGGAISILSLWAFVGGHDITVRYVFLWLSFFLLGQVGVELAVSKFQLEENYLYIALWQFLPNFSRLLLSAILIYFLGDRFNILFVSLVYAAVGIVSCVFAFTSMRKFRQGDFVLVGHGGASGGTYPNDEKRLVNFFSEAWPFFLAALFAFIYLQIDIVMLKYISGDEEAGLYNVAFVIINAAIIFPSVLYSKFFFSKYQIWAHSDFDKLRSAYLSGNKFMLVLGVAGGVILVLISWWLVPTLFGIGYVRSVTALNILALSLPLYFVAYSAGAVLTTGKQIRKKISLMGMAALINLILNFLLIPSFGMVGAAVSTVISNFVLLLLYLKAASRLFSGGRGAYVGKN